MNFRIQIRRFVLIALAVIVAFASSVAVIVIAMNVSPYIFDYKIRDRVMPDGNARITGISYPNTENLGKMAYELVIPESIDGHTVTEIGYGAISMDDGIQYPGKIILPRTLKRIASRAFINSDNNNPWYYSSTTLTGFVCDIQFDSSSDAPIALSDVTCDSFEGTDIMNCNFGAFHVGNALVLMMPFRGYGMPGRLDVMSRIADNNMIIGRRAIGSYYYIPNYDYYALWRTVRIIETDYSTLLPNALYTESENCGLILRDGVRRIESEPEQNGTIYYNAAISEPEQNSTTYYSSAISGDLKYLVLPSTVEYIGHHGIDIYDVYSDDRHVDIFLDFEAVPETWDEEWLDTSSFSNEVMDYELHFRGEWDFDDNGEPYVLGEAS